MGAAGSSAASSAATTSRRAFPAAASSASRRAFPTGPRGATTGREQQQQQQQQQQAPGRSLPKHLQAVVAEKAGELDGRSLARSDVGVGSALLPSSPPNMNADTSLAEAGMVDLDSLSEIVGPGLSIEGSTRADTMASGNQARMVEELRAQFEAGGGEDPAAARDLGGWLDTLGTINTRTVRAETADVRQSGALEVLRGINVDALNDFLHDADDIAVADGDPLCLSLESAVPLVAESYGLDRDVSELLLRYHAVPAYVNEGGSARGGRGAKPGGASDLGGDGEAAGMQQGPKWRGFWPHRLAGTSAA